jgi:hypothetical protein
MERSKMEYGHRSIVEIRALMHDLANLIEGDKIERRGAAMTLRVLAEQTKRRPCARGVRAPEQVRPMTEATRRRVVRWLVDRPHCRYEAAAQQFKTSIGRVAEAMRQWRDGELTVDGCVPV